VARRISNNFLGQIGRGDTVPEFEKALFGAKLPFDVVRDDIAERLHAMVEENMQLHAALFMERWIR